MWFLQTESHVRELQKARNTSLSKRVASSLQHSLSITDDVGIYVPQFCLPEQLVAQLVAFIDRYLMIRTLTQLALIVYAVHF